MGAAGLEKEISVSRKEQGRDAIQYCSLPAPAPPWCCPSVALSGDTANQALANPTRSNVRKALGTGSHSLPSSRIHLICLSGASGSP